MIEKDDDRHTDPRVVHVLVEDVPGIALPLDSGNRRDEGFGGRQGRVCIGQGGVDLVTPAWAERMLRFPDAVGESAFDVLLVGIRDGDFVHRAVGDGEGERISGLNFGERVLSRQVE